MIDAFTDLVRPLLDLVLPVACAGCGAPDVSFCPRCATALDEPARTPPLGAVQRALLPGVRVRSCARYEGAVVRLVHAWKDGGRLDLGRPLASTLARAVAALEGEPMVLVPVPSARSAVRRRGEDVVAQLARDCARELGRELGRSSLGRFVGRPPSWPVATPLRQVRRIADQAGLGVRDRAANVRGAFEARHGPPRSSGSSGSARTALRAVVVDDVLTTGASAGEAVRALRAAGWSVAGVATVCATPRHGTGHGDPPSDGCRPGSPLD